MGDEVADLIALYNKHKMTLLTLHGAGILEEEEWGVISMYLDNSEALENIKAIEKFAKLEDEVLKMSETHAQSLDQGAKSEQKPNKTEPKSDGYPTSKTPREPTSDPEFIARQVNGWQWLRYPGSSA